MYSWHVEFAVCVPRKGHGEGADMYFNYHAKAKALINGDHLTSYEIVDDWNGINPALVLHFDNKR